ncbi:MAG: arylsulfatase [Cupriavidus necator]
MQDRDREPFKGTIGRTYRDSVPHWTQPDSAPAAAPNVVLIVLDDVGFSDLGCYGSEIHTPNLDALAANGVRYNNFHVTSMCSPTRACLMSGRNAHAVGVGIIAEWSNGFPAYQGRMTHKAATLPEMLTPYGYGSYASGKWHLTHLSDYGAAGPHGDWPLGRGFARWYGFHGALANQWHPEMYEDNHPIHLAHPEGYHLSTDLIDHAIAQIRDHVTSTPSRPFFEYLAFGACHWPHHVPKAYIEKYRGRYDRGWDALREERLARQKSLGIVPASTQLAPRNAGVGSWENIPHDEKRAGCLLQETYAAFLEHTDAEIGRLIRYLEATGKLNNTLIMLVSDNGASSEGGSMGAFNIRSHLTHYPGSPQDVIARQDQLGGEHSYSHYPMGWAQVSNTPLKWYKKNTHGGGVRAPLILHWPRGIQARGEIRDQFHHAIDILPTVLDCAGIEAPQMHNGYEQLPVDGISMRYTFDDGAAATRRRTQYFELLGNRAIWHDGWKAVAAHVQGERYEDDRWELYRLDEDFSECRDHAAERPVQLQALIDLWWREAERHGVLPLDDRQQDRSHALRKLRAPVTRHVYQADMARIDRLQMPDISERNYSITVRLSGLTAGTCGVVLSWGGRFAGFVLYAKDGKLVYEYHYTETIAYQMQVPLPCGEAEVTLRFSRTGDHRGSIGLLVDGREEANLELPRLWWAHGASAGLTCGLAGVPMSPAYRPPYRFDATIESLVLTIEHDADTHLEQAFQTLMTEE